MLLWDMTEQEFRKAIDDTGFLLYGRPKVELRKLREAFANEDASFRVRDGGDAFFGNKVLDVTLGNPYYADGIKNNPNKDPVVMVTRHYSY